MYLQHIRDSIEKILRFCADGQRPSIGTTARRTR
jgi:hypothetical protein